MIAKSRWDGILINVNAATMTETSEKPYGTLHDVAIAWRDGKIVFMGPCAELPASPEIVARTVIDGAGGWVTPGLIDCHTHLVYGGNRAREFEMRLQGATYEQIARAGGGIASTVAATRAASEEELLSSALRRADHLLREGVTTLEIKSGYGLETETELRMLKVARRIEALRPVHVCTTFLGAHAVPPDWDQGADAYVDLVCSEMIPAVAGAKLADAVDVFCEGIAFSVEQSRRVFLAARDHGLRVKGHAEQLSTLGGARLVAEFDGLSADHLECLDDAGIQAMAEKGTVAVLLPGAFYTLRDTRVPPIEALRRAGVAMAVSTDCNPGTSPTTSLLLMMNMACTLFLMTPEEALCGTTCHAAKALGLEDRGVVKIGARADLVLWDIEHPAELSYALGANPCRGVVFGGAYHPMALHA